MFHLIHCCLKATHKQDSRWSLVVCISATFTQIINMGILRSSGVLFPVLMQEFGTTRERTGKLQINSIRRHRNNNYTIIIINNDVLTVYQKTNACIVILRSGTDILVVGPNGCNKLLEMHCKFSYNLMRKLIMALFFN